MADFHILESDVKDHKIRVVFHIAVPDEQNIAGLNLQTAMAEYKHMPGTIIRGLLEPEVDQINAGELYEHAEWVRYNGNLTNTKKLNIVSSRHAALSISVANWMRLILKYWGYSK